MSKYSSLQIAIHWAVVVMVITQWWTSDAIPRTHNPLLPATQWDLFLHLVHNYCGMGIGAFVSLRMVLRLQRRTLLQTRSPRFAEIGSAVVHWGLYVSLLAQAVTGFVAAYFWGPAAGVHKALWNVTLALVALHVLAALWHGVRRDGVFGRMLPGVRIHPGLDV